MIGVVAPDSTGIATVDRAPTAIDDAGVGTAGTSITLC